MLVVTGTQKISAENVNLSFNRIAPLRAATFSDVVTKYLAARINGIREYEKKISEEIHAGISLLKANSGDKFIDPVDSDSIFRIGVGDEIEFYLVGQLAAYLKRQTQYSKAVKSHDPSLSNMGDHLRMTLENVGDSFMPEDAQAATLNKLFELQNMPQAGSYRITREPSYRQQYFDEIIYDAASKSYDRRHIAVSQIEINSTRPHSPIGAALHCATFPQIALNSASKYGLHRAEFVSLFNEGMSPSSVHLHLSLTGKKAGELVNPLERDFWPKERGTRPKDNSQISQLGLYIADAMVDFIKTHCFLFAPISSAYRRLAPTCPGGPSFIGFGPHRESGSNPSMMIRGAGRLAERPNSANPNKFDGGPLRFELRIPDISAIGHPAIEFYPWSIMGAFDVVESYLHMVYRGVFAWKKNEEDHINNPSLKRTPKTEDALYQNRHPLPQTREEAWERIVASRELEGFLTAKRLEVIHHRAGLQERLSALDSALGSERGQHINRTNKLTDLLSVSGF